MIEGTAVRPNVSRANTPRVKVQMGRADISSWGGARTGEAIVVPLSIMSVDDGSRRIVCNGFLVGRSFHLVEQNQ
jgi:hypothetical protein